MRRRTGVQRSCTPVLLSTKSAEGTFSAVSCAASLHSESEDVRPFGPYVRTVAQECCRRQHSCAPLPAFAAAKLPQKRAGGKPFGLSDGRSCTAPSGGSATAPLRSFSLCSAKQKAAQRASLRCSPRPFGPWIAAQKPTGPKGLGF